MTNIELQPAQQIDLTERDAFQHYGAILDIALQVALEEKDAFPPSTSRREYIYAVIDLAKEAGYTIDNIEAITFLDKALEKLQADDQFESNLRDGTWDENGSTIDYVNADKTGEQ